MECRASLAKANAGLVQRSLTEAQNPSGFRGELMDEAWLLHRRASQRNQLVQEQRQPCGCLRLPQKYLPGTGVIG